MIQIKDLPDPADTYPVRRALLSVFDKTGVVDFANTLHSFGTELLSTGGTARALREAGLPVTDIADLTAFPEMLDGRVKTLHPAVHSGILARRTDPEDLAQLDERSFVPIDLVVVNLYPFAEAVADVRVSDSTAIENIDIGGPTLIRAAAKNFFFVGVVTDPADYGDVVRELNNQAGALSMKTRRALAHKAFARTAVYDRAIDAYFTRSSSSQLQKEVSVPTRLSLDLPLAQALRYGENPHQAAGLFGNPGRFFEQLHGKELSFNNLLDLSAALRLIDEFRESAPTCAILKHTNPCGVAVADELQTAYHSAFATDRQSPFGGIVIVNRPLDFPTAEAINHVFTEIIIAPEYGEGVLALLMKKKNRRLIRSLRPASEDTNFDVRTVLGGVLVQRADPVLPPIEEQRSVYRVVTRRAPSDAEWEDLDFAWRIAKNVKSNAIVYARGRTTLGIGAGQMSRIDSSELAVMKGKKSKLEFSDSVIASDAFFPFADGLLEAARNGVVAAIQPGGSIRDDEVIQAADEHDIAMVFTGKRHFRH